MAERPILFSAPMVRAILAGRKSQTRRVLRLPTKTASGGPIYEHPKMGGWAVTTHGGGGCFRIGRGGEKIPVPERPGIWHQTTGVGVVAPYEVGDVLWAREALQCDLMENFLTGERDTNAAVAYYAADDTEVVDRAGFNLAWVWKRGALPAMFMPRAFSRITLKVTGVKVERLQDISEEDATAEGVEHDSDGWIDYLMPATQCFARARDSYCSLWESINGPGSWGANPWVAAISFERIPTEAPTG